MAVVISVGVGAARLLPRDEPVGAVHDHQRSRALPRATGGETLSVCEQAVPLTIPTDVIVCGAVVE